MVKDSSDLLYNRNLHSSSNYRGFIYNQQSLKEVLVGKWKKQPDPKYLENHVEE